MGQAMSNPSSLDDKPFVVPADTVAAKDWPSMAQILAEQIFRLVITPPVPFGDLVLDSSGLDGHYYIRNVATAGYLCGKGASTPPHEGREVKVCSDPSVGTDKRDTFKVRSLPLHIALFLRPYKCSFMSITLAVQDQGPLRLFGTPKANTTSWPRAQPERQNTEHV